MDKKKIIKELIEIITPYVPEKELIDNIDESKELINDLHINSAHIVDIVLDVEEKYDIMIDDDAIGKMNTVGESVSMIMEKIKS
ncbi:MAG: acyl carrier protein [Cyclobacteriaceae bacterium]|nr:acyl carrier protein [Cyclobacteriaceae bacterium SS2]